MNSSLTFLGSVADYFMSGVKGRPAPSTVNFVVPNKRSALFLKKYVRERSREISLMPRFMTMRTFLGIYSDYPAAQPRELLFVLYDAYRRVMSRKGRTDGVRQFDSFIFWGDMMLNDFDDVDKALVDADSIFRNLKNVKEIQADYLNEEQKDVIRRVWGESRLTAHIEEFWLHLGNGEECRLGEKFVYLWEILSDIYHEYKRILKESYRASEGTLYRLAVDNVRNYEAYDFTGDTQYAFVGFNDLSAAETLIFERLKRKGVASFFWDTAPLSLFPDDKGRRPLTLQRLADLSRHFRMPEDYTVPVRDERPEISVTSVPSNVAQAKCIAGMLEDWTAKGYLDPNNAINTAVILPDQSLLLPTLLSIPEDIKALNISMGLAYRTTTFASLLHSIISMQLRARKIRGEYNFYFEDLNAVLCHPHIQTIAPEAADRVTAYINGNKMYNAPAKALCEVAPELKEVFVPVRDTRDAGETAAYLAALLERLGDGLSRKSDDGPAERGSMFELEAIKYFREELDKLTDLIKRYGVEMADHTFLHLFERVFSNRGLTLTGTPLQGLQVLGVLETRGLDFDNVIILSMNEGIYTHNDTQQPPQRLRPGRLRQPRVELCLQFLQACIACATGGTFLRFSRGGYRSRREIEVYTAARIPCTRYQDKESHAGNRREGRRPAPVRDTEIAGNTQNTRGLSPRRQETAVGLGAQDIPRMSFLLLSQVCARHARQRRAERGALGIGDRHYSTRSHTALLRITSRRHHRCLNHRFVARGQGAQRARRRGGADAQGALQRRVGTRL